MADDNGISDLPCPLCKGPLIRKKSRFGEFYGCSRYPKCAGSRRLESSQNPPTPEQETDVVSGLSLAIEFVRKMGGVEKARRWIGIVEASVSLTVADQPEETTAEESNA